MADYLDQGLPTDNKPDSIQNLYFVFRSIMKELLTEHDKYQMILRVVEDIVHDAETISKIKSLKRKKRIFLASLIWNWQIRNLNTHFPPQFSMWSPNGITAKSTGPDLNKQFRDNFKEAFSHDVYRVCRYNSIVKDLSRSFRRDGDTFYFSLHDGSYYYYRDSFTKSVMKYDSKKNILNIRYIEISRTTTWYREFTGEDFAREVFPAAEELAGILFEENGIKPTIVWNKNYDNVYKKFISCKR